MITGTSGVFAGRVIHVWAHPNADRLRVAEVECGGDKLQVVFGGRLDAVETDSVVPVARPGARVPGRRKKLRKLRFRGVESNGMLCSLTELGWTTECPDEVAVLKNVQPGAQLDRIGEAERREVVVLASPDSVSWAPSHSATHRGDDLVVRRVDAGDAPAAQAVEALYHAASAGPPLNEPPAVAQLYAEIYRTLSPRPDARVVMATAPDLVGFCYGHPWRWSEQTDEWAGELRERLGERAARSIDGAFAIRLLAVRPECQRRGLGRALLDTACGADGFSHFWLETTDIRSPARRLYESAGWTPLGYGPDSPDGRPGVVLHLTRAS